MTNKNINLEELVNSPTKTNEALVAIQNLRIHQLINELEHAEKRNERLGDSIENFGNQRTLLMKFIEDQNLKKELKTYFKGNPEMSDYIFEFFETIF